ncbi:MAG: UvrD-helicase domain-containing protein [Flavobacterium sp.]|nr:UvrD-helicase domain-containing protein [Pedobacter sp.]
MPSEKPSLRPLKILQASAGSGKTFSLTAHYLTLLFFNDKKYREILAVTFTNKATAEMKGRILTVLKDIASGKPDAKSYIEIIRETHPDLSDVLLQQKATTIYRNILHDYSRFTVTTIDGFVQQVIRSFAFELNLDSGYRLEMNFSRVKEDLVQLLNEKLESDETLLNWVTGIAIDRISNGQDWNYHRSLIDLASELFKESYFPFQYAMEKLDVKGKAILLEQLTTDVNSGIQVFEEKIKEIVKSAHTIWIASGVDLAELFGKSNNPLKHLKSMVENDLAELPQSLFKLIDSPDAWQKGKQNDNVQELYNKLNPLLKVLQEFYLEHIFGYKMFQALQQNAVYLRLVQEMTDLMNTYRTENQLMLISDAQRFLLGVTGVDTENYMNGTESPVPENPSFIWEKTGNKFKNFLFDEFQDTSRLQWINFLPLLSNAIAAPTPDMTDHLIVGDVKQSIYRWRNGDWNILLSGIKKDLKEHNVTENNLEYNYRSKENIISFNNLLYSVLPEILQMELNSDVEKEAGESYLRDVWEKRSLNQIILQAYAGSTQLVPPGNTAGGQIDVFFTFNEAVDNDDDENNDETVPLKIVKEKLLWLLGEKNLKQRDICLLVRKKSEAETLINYLLKRQNEFSAALNEEDFQIISAEALVISNNPAVQLVVNTLRMMANLDADNSVLKSVCLRLYREITTGIVDISLKEWMALSRNKMADLTGIFPEGLCRNYVAWKHYPLTELADKLISVYGLTDKKFNSYTAYLLALTEQIAVFTSTGDKGLNPFLEWWDEEGSSKSLPSSESQNAVQIMTIHKSKGLDFKAVIIPFCNWTINEHSSLYKKITLWADTGDTPFDHFNRLPVNYIKDLARSAFAKSYYEEKLYNAMDAINLLYVATTRSVDYLCIIAPERPKKSGNDMQQLLLNIIQVRISSDSPFNGYFEDNVFSYGSFDLNHVVLKKEEKEGLKMENYPASGFISSKFDTLSESRPGHYNPQQRKGIILHTLLEKINHINDAEKLIEEFRQEGFIRESEKEEIKSRLLSTLAHPQIKHWMETAKEISSEQEMITSEGKILRPDKLFIFDDKAVLLDFKFGEEDAKYTLQLQEYASNLLQMEVFSLVEPYIYYDLTGKMMKV